LPDGESTKRNWLVYSKTQISFLLLQHIIWRSFSRKTDVISFQEYKRIFSDWKHLYRFEEHEYSPEHKNNYFEWKFLEKRLKTVGPTDENLQKAVQSGKEKWKKILKTVLDVTFFLCPE
jgi:type II secretory pathway component PulJ